MGEFITWLARPEQQRRWYRRTSYFPVYRRARGLLRDGGWFDKHPGFAVAPDQLAEAGDTLTTRGARVGPFTTVRAIVSESLFKLFDGRDLDTVLAAMDKQVSTRLSEYKHSAGRWLGVGATNLTASVSTDPDRSRPNYDLPGDAPAIES